MQSKTPLGWESASTTFSFPEVALKVLLVVFFSGVEHLMMDAGNWKVEFEAGK